MTRERIIDPPPISVISSSSPELFKFNDPLAHEAQETLKLQKGKVYLRDIPMQVGRLRATECGEHWPESSPPSEDNILQQLKQCSGTFVDYAWTTLVYKSFAQRNLETRARPFTFLCPDMTDLERACYERMAADPLSQNPEYSLKRIPYLVGEIHKNWREELTFGNTKSKSPKTPATPGIHWNEQQIAKRLDQLSFFKSKLLGIYRDRIEDIDKTYQDDPHRFGEADPSLSDYVSANQSIFFTVRFPDDIQIQYYVRLPWLTIRSIPNSAPHIEIIQPQFGQPKPEDEFTGQIKKLITAAAVNRFLQVGTNKLKAMPVEYANPYGIVFTDKVYKTAGEAPYDISYHDVSLKDEDIPVLVEKLHALAQDWVEHKDLYADAKNILDPSQYYVLPFIPTKERDLMFQPEVRIISAQSDKKQGPGLWK